MYRTIGTVQIRVYLLDQEPGAYSGFQIRGREVRAGLGDGTQRFKSLSGVQVQRPGTGGLGDRS